MPTQRQKRVAKLLIENATLDKPLNGGEIVESGRYSHSMVIKPSVVLESQGVKEALNDYGFTIDNAKKVVARILLDDETEPNARLKASDQVFKVHGGYAPEKRETVSVNINATPEEMNKYNALRDKYEQELKQQLLNDQI